MPISRFLCALVRRRAPDMEAGENEKRYVGEKDRPEKDAVSDDKMFLCLSNAECDTLINKNKMYKQPSLAESEGSRASRHDSRETTSREKFGPSLQKDQLYVRLSKAIVGMRGVLYASASTFVSKVAFFQPCFCSNSISHLFSFASERRRMLRNGARDIYLEVLRFLRINSSSLRTGASVILVLWLARWLVRFLLYKRRLTKLSGSKPGLIVPELNFSEALRRIRFGEVRQVDYSDNSRIFIKGQNGQTFFSHIVPGAELAFFATVSEKVPIFRYVRKVNPGYLLQSLFPFVFLFVWWRVLKSLMNQNEQFKGSDACRAAETVCFSDVVSKAKEELEEVVEYLNNPEIFKAAGARMPRGVLLIGPSGTGKTLIARAVAGEARVPFISCSASEFIEVYVGRGAKRIRSLFEAARRCAPSVLFIDELDAVGNRWSRQFGAGHEEYVQTINQLLTELDGFYGGSDGVIVIAATNRYGALDEALLRSGRFDRHVHLTLPDEDDRLQILLLHAKKKKLKLDSTAVDMLPQVAASCEGFSGADLENLLNESIYYALRRNKQEVGLVDLEKAVESLLPRRAINISSSAHTAPSFAASSPPLSHDQRFTVDEQNLELK